jgi:beta-glucosidase
VVVLGLCAAMPACAPPVDRPWLDTAQPIEQRVGQLLAALTLDEKIGLLYGVAPPASSPGAGYIPGIDRLGVPPQVFADGPVGLRDRIVAPRNPATALPASVALGATFNPVLAKRYGALLGNEARARGVDVLYGPAMNIVRVPVGGRNFEYFSEDPYLTGRLAVPYVQGVQSQRVAAQIKHFALNNQENLRHTKSSNADERTMREIYFPAWQAAVQEGQSWSVMCANNPVNHVYSCENPELLRDVLEGEWGFDGVVGSDYGATRSTIGSVEAGLDQSFTLRDWGAFYRDLPQLVSDGLVSEATIDERARRVLRMMFRIGLFDGNRFKPTVDVPAHGLVARDVAEQSMVLLRNNRDLLPLQVDEGESIAVIGPYATQAYTGGGGSSHVIPYYTVTPAEGIAQRAGPDVHVRSDDGSDVSRAAGVARDADVAVVVVGDQSREGSDRTNMDLPGNQNDLISAVAAANPNTVVVLHTGGPVTMPWLNEISSLIEAWYPGQEVGNALAALLFGDVDASGRLPVTFPISADQAPTMGAPRYPAGPDGYDYDEGLNVGYRGYDARNLDVQFPFGFGLSYTEFTYANLEVTTDAADQEIHVTFSVTNSGTRAGIAVPQVYVGFPPEVGEPPQQLKGFDRLAIAPNSTRQVSLTLPVRALEYWSSGWRTAPGAYQISVGSSSRDLALTTPVTLQGS